MTLFNSSHEAEIITTDIPSETAFELGKYLVPRPSLGIYSNTCSRNVDEGWLRQVR